MNINKWSHKIFAKPNTVEVLFIDPEYRPNLSNMIRTAEFYGLERVFISDKNNLLLPPNSKMNRAEMEHLGRVWTAGAVDFIEIVLVENLNDFLSTFPGRKIATVLDDSVQELHGFQFIATDLLIMGPEKEGIPSEYLELCDVELTILPNGQTECLNVSTSFGIFLNQFIKSLAT